MVGQCLVCDVVICPQREGYLCQACKLEQQRLEWLAWWGDFRYVVAQGRRSEFRSQVSYRDIQRTPMVMAPTPWRVAINDVLIAQGCWLDGWDEAGAA